jgi:hypothetical protein
MKDLFSRKKEDKKSKNKNKKKESRLEVGHKGGPPENIRSNR